MQTQKPFFDDLARMAGGALGALSGVRAEMEALIRQQMERFMAGRDMVPREEFEVVRDMAIKARTEQEALARRLADLEAALAAVASVPTAPVETAAPAGAKRAARRARSNTAS